MACDVRPSFGHAGEAWAAVNASRERVDIDLLIRTTNFSFKELFISCLTNAICSNIILGAIPHSIIVFEGASISALSPKDRQ
jgi:hypothetical protein